MRRKVSREITITGTILPTDLDDDGEVRSIRIETPDGAELIIFMNTIGEEMMRHINRMVKATGTVKEMYGDLIFTVTGYQLLERNPERA